MMPLIGLFIIKPEMNTMFLNNAISMISQSYLLTHTDSDVDHLIKLHPEYAEAVDNRDTNKLWISL